MKNCVACGMPMDAPADFAMGDARKDYCRYCARPDGSMQDFAEKVESMGRFLARTEGLEMEAARAEARDRLRGLPAWKGR